MGQKRVIIDLDVGTDDYLGLLLLIYAEKLGDVHIEAITCSHGNTNVENVTRNVVRLLEMLNRTDIPVYKGASSRLIRPNDTIKQFHGSDGFGDLQYDSEPDLTIIKDGPAAIAFHKILSENPKEISLICVGPLTNLALAIKLYDDFVDNVKDVWIMGGNHSAVGNITSSAEYNFYSDPEAAHIVFECLKCPIYLLPWETCLVPKISFEWRYNNLGGQTPAMDLLTRAEKAIYPPEEPYWLPCDAFLVFAFLNSKDHIRKKTMHHATIELNSSYTRGQVVLDHRKSKEPNVIVIEEIEELFFKDMVLEVGTKLV